MDFNAAFDRLIGHEGYAAVGCLLDLPDTIS